MEIGVSTASLFRRQHNEDALVTLNELDARVCEIFLGTYSEYNKDFATLLKSRLGNLKVHSIHTLNTHFEPQLFSSSDRALADAYKIYGDCLEVGKTLNASAYTMHGIARFKKNVLYNNYEKIGKNLELAKDFAKNYGIKLTLENVEWAYYNHVGFYKNITKYCKDLNTCLDVKQARISGDSYKDYIEEMGSSIYTVHLSDFNDSEHICLPGMGNFDFEDLFIRLKDVGFNGAMLIEVYTDDYGDIFEIKQSLDYLRELQYKIF